MQIKSQTCCWSHSHCSMLNMSHSHCSRPVSHSHCSKLNESQSLLQTCWLQSLLQTCWLQSLFQFYWSHSHCSSLTGVTVTAPDLLESQSLFHLLVTVTVPVSLESQSLLQSIGVTVTVCSSFAEVNVPNLKQ